MIPLFAIIRISTRQRRLFGLWLPLFLVWLLLLPIAVLLIPFFVIGCMIARLNPWHVFSTSWQLIAGLKGTDIDVEHSRGKVLVRIV